MDQLKWHREYEVGNELIDAQHRQLFEKIGGCIEATHKGLRREELCACLQDVQECMVGHFRSEESQMTDGSKETLSHWKQHAYITNRIQDEITKYRDKADDRNSPQGILYYLHDWYVNHLGSADSCWGCGKPGTS